MEETLRQLDQLSDPSMRTLVHLIDILLVAYLIYRVMLLIRGTRAWRILWGVVGFVLLLFISRVLQFTALHWVLDKATLLGPVALVILLLPELRQALEGIGKLGIWPQKLVASDAQTEAKTVEEIVAAVSEMAQTNVGALIVIERGPPLDEVVANGVLLEAKVSAALLCAIFYEGNPLHDGAVVIRRDTIVAAACRLPLSDSLRLDPNLHMRHRAAVGAAESYDCFTIVVSEERGSVSVASEGRLQRLQHAGELRELMTQQLRDMPDRSISRNGKGKSKRRATDAKAE